MAAGFRLGRICRVMNLPVTACLCGRLKLNARLFQPGLTGQAILASYGFSACFRNRFAAFLAMAGGFAAVNGFTGFGDKKFGHFFHSFGNRVGAAGPGCGHVDFLPMREVVGINRLAVNYKFRTARSVEKYIWMRINLRFGPFVSCGVLHEQQGGYQP